MASNTKKTKVRRKLTKAKMGKARKKQMQKPGTYKLLSLKETE